MLQHRSLRICKKKYAVGQLPGYMYFITGKSYTHTMSLHNNQLFNPHLYFSGPTSGRGAVNGSPRLHNLPQPVFGRLHWFLQYADAFVFSTQLSPSWAAQSLSGLNLKYQGIWIHNMDWGSCFPSCSPGGIRIQCNLCYWHNSAGARCQRFPSCPSQVEWWALFYITKFFASLLLPSHP